MENVCVHRRIVLLYKVCTGSMRNQTRLVLLCARNYECVTATILNMIVFLDDYKQF